MIEKDITPSDDEQLSALFGILPPVAPHNVQRINVLRSVAQWFEARSGQPRFVNDARLMLEYANDMREIANMIEKVQHGT